MASKKNTTSEAGGGEEMPRPVLETADKGGREEKKSETDLARELRQSMENQEKKRQKIRESEDYRNLVDKYEALKAGDISEFSSLDEFFKILNDTLSTFGRKDLLRKPTELFLEDHKGEWFEAAKPEVKKKPVSSRRRKEAGAEAPEMPKAPEEQLYSPEEVRRRIREWFPILAVRDAGYAGGDRTRRVSNLDGNSCLFLFRKILGFASGTEEEKKYVFDEVKYVPAGRVAEGALNLDTSDHVEGGLAEKGTGFVDHHGKESPRQSSAFRTLYEYFQDADFLPKMEEADRQALERLAAFVTYIDSYTLPKKGEQGLSFSPHWAEAWRDSDRTLFGVSLIYQNEIPPEELFEFFKKYSLEDALSKDIYTIKDVDLEKIRKLGNRFLKEDKINTEKFVDNERNFKRRVFESPFFGRILAGVQERGDAKIVGLQFAALARGFDGSLLYRPDNNSFALSVGPHKTIPPELADKVPGAEWIRGGMVVKPPSKEIPVPNLNDLIKLLSGEEPGLAGAQAGEPTAAEKQRPQPEAVNPAFAMGEEVVVRPDIHGVDALSGVSKRIIDSVHNAGVNYYQLEGVERRYREEWLMKKPEAPREAGGKAAVPVREEVRREERAERTTFARAEAPLVAPAATAPEAPAAMSEEEFNLERNLRRAIEEKLKQKVAGAKQEFEAKKQEWEKYQGLLGFFRGRGKSKEDKSAIQQEYEAAKEKYARVKAELVAFKAFNYLEQESQLEDGFGRVIAKTLERKRGGAAREWGEKIYAGYKKLGEWNVAKLFKFEDKLAAWQPDSKLGKTGKVLANLGSRFLSVRTALSFGLLGAGIWAGAGVTLATGIFAARRGLATFGGFFGANEVWKGVEKTKLLKEISQDKLKKMSDAELVARLREIEVYNLLEGKEEFGGYGYDQIRKELEERLSRPAEAAETAPAETMAGVLTPERTAPETERLPPPEERSAAEIGVAKRGERTEKKLKDLLEDVDGQLKAAEAKFKKKRTHRLAAATLTAGLFGSGLWGEAYGWLLKKGMGLAGWGAEVPVGAGGAAGAGVGAAAEGGGGAGAVTGTEGAGVGAKNAVAELQEQMKALGQEARATGQKFLDSLEAMKEKASAVLKQALEASHTQELATLQKGEGVISILRRQLEDNPSKFGFTGDVHDATAVQQWAEHQAANVAVKQGYWDPSTGRQNWVRWNPQASMRFVLEGDAQHGFKVSETGTEGRHFIHQPTEAERRAKLEWRKFDEDWARENAAGLEKVRGGVSALVKETTLEEHGDIVDYVYGLSEGKRLSISEMERRIQEITVARQNGAGVGGVLERIKEGVGPVRERFGLSGAGRIQEAVGQAVGKATGGAPLETVAAGAGGRVSVQELKMPTPEVGPGRGFTRLGLVGGQLLDAPANYEWKEAASIHASLIDEKIKVAEELAAQYQSPPGLKQSAVEILAAAKKDAVDFATQVHAGKSASGYETLERGKTLAEYHTQVLIKMRAAIFQKAAMAGGAEARVVEATPPPSVPADIKVDDFRIGFAREAGQLTTEFDYNLSTLGQKYLSADWTKLGIFQKDFKPSTYLDIFKDSGGLGEGKVGRIDIYQKALEQASDGSPQAKAIKGSIRAIMGDIMAEVKEKDPEKIFHPDLIKKFWKYWK